MTDKIDVAVIIGSDSDWPFVEPCAKTLKQFGLAYEVRVISAHRTPELLVEYVSKLPERGAQVVVAAAGWAAALGGVVAAHTHLPVVGIPIPNSPLAGLDSILSTLQMPGGVPVATMSLGKAGATNAAIFAARVIALSRSDLASKLDDYQKTMVEKVAKRNNSVQDKVKELS